MRLARQFGFDPRGCASPDANRFRGFHNAHAFGQQLANFAFCRGRKRGRPSKGFALGSGPRKTGTDPLLDHGALEFGKDAHHLKHCAPAWRGSVQALLMQIQINPFGVQIAKKAHKVLQGPAKPIHGPCGNHIEITSRNTLAELVEARPLFAALAAGNAFVLEHCNDLPVMAGGNGFQFAPLIGNCLAASGNAQIQRNTLRHWISLSVINAETLTRQIVLNQLFWYVWFTASKSPSIPRIYSSGARRGFSMVPLSDVETHTIAASREIVGIAQNVFQDSQEARTSPNRFGWYQEHANAFCGCTGFSRVLKRDRDGAHRWPIPRLVSTGAPMSELAAKKDRGGVAVGAAVEVAGGRRTARSLPRKNSEIRQWKTGT